MVILNGTAKQIPHMHSTPNPTLRLAPPGSNGPSSLFPRLLQHSGCPHWRLLLGAAWVMAAVSGFRAEASESEVSQQALTAAKSGALGFDTLVMAQRKPLNPTHVYTYHVEGLEKGGGLYTLALKDGKLDPLGRCVRRA